MSIKTTIHLNLATVRRQLDHPLIIMALTAVVVVAAGFMTALGNRGALDHAAAVPTPALPVILIATAAPVTPVAQIASAGPNVTPRALVAYDAPDGRALGAIEQGRPYQVLASWGASWLQVDVTGSGAVWLKAADLLGMPAGLVDLQPTATAIVVVREAPAAAPAAGQTYQVSDDPPTPDWYHDIATPPAAFTNALIDPSRPNAPACENPTTHQISPLCGDLTNREAMTAIAGGH